MVKVRFFTLIREKAGVNEIDLSIDGEMTVVKLLELIQKKIGKQFLEGLLLKNGNLIDRAVVLVNGRNISHLRGFETIVKDGDEVSLFPPGGGG